MGYATWLPDLAEEGTVSEARFELSMAGDDEHKLAEWARKYGAAALDELPISDCVDDLRDEIDDLEKQVETLEEEKADLTAELGAAEKENAQFEAKIEELEAELAKVRASA